MHGGSECAGLGLEVIAVLTPALLSSPSSCFADQAADEAEDEETA